MSVRCMSWAWTVQGIDSTSAFVLLALADHANDEDFKCWPSLKHLAKKCRINKVTVERALKRLEKAGLIARQRRNSDKRSHLSTVYKLNTPLGAERTYPLGAQDTYLGAQRTYPLGAQRTPNHQLIEPSIEGEHAPSPYKNLTKQKTNKDAEINNKFRRGARYGRERKETIAEHNARVTEELDKSGAFDAAREYWAKKGTKQN